MNRSWAHAPLLMAAFLAPAEAAPPTDDVQDFVLLVDTRPVRVRLHVRIDDRPFPAVWDDFIGQLFKYLDVNGDGSLDAAEIERIPSADLLLARGVVGFGLPDDRLKLRGPLPRNKAGKVTARELAACYRKNGLVPLQVQVGPTRQTLATFAQLRMGNRMRATPLRPEPESGDAVARTTFALLDTNKDGKLTREELAAAATALRRADRNDDELVTVHEMLAYSHLIRQAVTPGPAPVTLVSSDRRKPDLELTVHLSTRGAPARIERNAQETGQAREKDGGIHLGLGTVNVQFRPGSDAVRPPGLERFLRLDNLFDLLDKDKKGYLSEADALRPGSGLVRGHFKMMDRNGDGKVTEKELAGYLRQMSHLQALATASCVTLVFIEEGRGLFDLLDTNRDGRLSGPEIHQAAKVLARLDKGGKGFITPKDVPRSCQLLVRRGPAGGPGFGALGLGGPGFMAAPAPQKTTGPLWFHRMDHNGDGYLSRREFLGSETLFRKIDRNGDGFISLEEALAADELARKKK
jgi:Ca2+-binding EF-hand superfamily protein